MNPRACAVVLALLVGCASEPQPETADYIIEAILVPYCGRAGCHTAETQPHNLAFDTIDNALAAMKAMGRDNMILVVPGDPSRSRLVTVLTDASRIMPPDSPLPDADIKLISDWVGSGAPGLQ